MKNYPAKIKHHGLQKALLILITKLLSPHFSLKYEFAKKFSPKQIRKVNDYKMFLNLEEDIGITKDLFLFGKREHLSTDFLIESDILKKGDCVLDVGANIGYYALLESKLVGNNGIIYAIEPVKQNFKTLKQNIALNKITNIKTFNLAIGDKVGTSTIYVNKKGNQSSMILHNEEDVKNQEEIEMTTLDSFVQEHLTTKPKLVRMDVEGYEYAIFEGMTNVLKNKPLLLIEFHPPLLTTTQKERMCSLLSENGYSKATIIKDYKCYELTLRGKINRYLYRKIRGKKTSARSINDRISEVSLGEFCEQLPHNKKSFHVLFRT